MQCGMYIPQGLIHNWHKAEQPTRVRTDRPIGMQAATQTVTDWLHKLAYRQSV